MEPDYTEKSWYILADERALAKQQREREEWLATSPFVARKRPSSRTAMAVALDSDEQKKEAPAVPALSYRSDATRFKEEDLDDLMTPLPKQVLEAGMYVTPCSVHVMHDNARMQWGVERSSHGLTDVCLVFPRWTPVCVPCLAGKRCTLNGERSAPNTGATDDIAITIDDMARALESKQRSAARAVSPSP